MYYKQRVCPMRYDIVAAFIILMQLLIYEITVIYLVAPMNDFHIVVLVIVASTERHISTTKSENSIVYALLRHI